MAETLVMDQTSVDLDRAYQQSNVQELLDEDGPSQGQQAGLEKSGSSGSHGML